MSTSGQRDAATLYAACSDAGNPRQQVDAFEQLWAYLYRVTHLLVRDQPDSAARAQDYAQIALIRVHDRLHDCREPAAFLGWARRIATNVVLDDLRRRRRLVPLDDDAWDDVAAERGDIDALRGVEIEAGQKIVDTQLAQMLAQAPISDRSRRVVIGRFLEEMPDSVLAVRESALDGRPVRTSHVQVTRSKNISKLRDYAPLLALLQEFDGS